DMLKRFSWFFTPLLIAIVLLTGCSSGQKMAARDASGTATRTPFLAKATFTATNTPLLLSGTEDGDVDLGAASSTASGETGTSQVETTELASSTPSLTPSPSGTPAGGLPPAGTLTPTATRTQLSTAAPSLTPQPSVTDVPANPTDTSSPLGATATPKTPSATPLPTSTPVPSSTPAPTATPLPAACSPTGSSSYENEVISLINQERQDRGLSPLTLNSSLRAAARRHSQDMACNDFFSHTGSDGSTLSSRLLDAGYSFSWAAENIAASSSSSFSAQSVVNMWMNSPGHRQNMLNENAVHIGVGFSYAGDGDAGDLDAYYTADFGKP
ncbi:MAG: CAP domain-containing protein, partial [Anaerolineales bacterium]